MDGKRIIPNALARYDFPLSEGPRIQTLRPSRIKSNDDSLALI